ncbi:MAG: sugar phosphate nucleotidyltransferase [Tepidiformaceae bacterium]
MDAIVLVGGQGTRLRPLTATRHKSLVPIANRPAISHLLEWLTKSGFGRAVLATGQESDDLLAAYPGGRAHGLEIVVVRERERLESGGAIRNAVRAAAVEGRFAVFNGDVFLDFDFARAAAAHQAADAELTLALYEMDDPSPFGVAVTGADGLVTGFVEKPPRGSEASKLVNAGAWIFEPGLVDEIPAGAVRVEETLFPSLVARGRRVLGYRFDGIWADFGTAARYLELNQALVSRQGRSYIAGGVPVAPGAQVRESSVGAGCVIGKGAIVSGSVLWEGVRIEADATVDGSVLADRVSVGAGARLSGAVVGSGAMIAERAVAPPGTSIEPGARYDGADD